MKVISFFTLDAKGQAVLLESQRKTCQSLHMMAQFSLTQMETLLLNLGG